MMAYTPFLLTGADWEALARRAAKRGRRLTAYFDAGCGVCFQMARVVARLDRFDRVRFVSSAELPPDSDLPPDLLAKTLVVVDQESGRRYTRADAVAQVLRALPVGWLWSLPWHLPGANWAYDLFARKRQTISTWLGLAACGIPGPSPSPSPATSPSPPPAAGPAPVRQLFRSPAHHRA